MTYNQIIKFLKNTPRPNGRKYDLYRAFAEKTNEDISYLKAVIIDDGFRYEPDEDGYVIEMNPKFLNKTTLVAYFDPNSGEFINRWDQYKHEDMDGFEAQLNGYNDDGKWICTIVDTSAPDIDSGGAYDALVAIVEHKDEISDDENGEYKVLKIVNSYQFRSDIHDALGEWDEVFNRYRAYQMEYEVGKKCVDDLHVAKRYHNFETGENDWDHILEDDKEKLNKIISNIKSVFKKHNVPYYGTGYVKGSLRGDPRYAVAELHPYFAKPGENHYKMVEDLIGERIEESLQSTIGEYCRRNNISDTDGFLEKCRKYFNFSHIELYTMANWDSLDRVLRERSLVDIFKNILKESR